MVAIVQTTKRTETGEIDKNAWFGRLSIRYPHERLKTLSQWFTYATPKGLEIANILLELHADLDAILAALLLEHTDDLDQPQFKELPAHITKLLCNVKDLNQVSEILFLQKRASKIEGIRQMMLAMIKDVRVVLVKLAERAFFARQMKTFTEEERARLAHEIAELYAPLANRLGIGALKWELEDRSFAVLEPDAYQEITKVLKTRRQEREAFIQNFLETLETTLEEAGVNSEITGRVKHIYSIWRKMQKKDLKFEDLYDVRAVRILVRDVATCYTVMALLHAKWVPLVSEYTDYIINPKPNGYRSLHTVLVGEDKLPIEVQIRTFDMHEQAESGVAAHWRYKEGGRENLAQERINWLRTLLEWQSEVSTGETPPKNFADLIYVFTKDNEVFALRQGATPVDFAFTLHTKVGLCAKGALVNGKMVPLNHTLDTGDQIEILVNKSPNPSHDWLIPSSGYLKTSHARQKLRAYFREVEATEKKPAPIEAPSAPVAPPPKKKAVPAKMKTGGVSISGVQNLPFQLARCCNPSQNDAIIASMTRARGLVIHKQSCPNIKYFLEKRPERLFQVSWI